MESFEVEEEADCSYDYLEIKSYGAKTEKKCTTITQKTAENKITVILPGKPYKPIPFKSDNDITIQ